MYRINRGEIHQTEIFGWTDRNQNGQGHIKQVVLYLSTGLRGAFSHGDIKRDRKTFFFSVSCLV